MTTGSRGTRLAWGVGVGLAATMIVAACGGAPATTAPSAATTTTPSNTPPSAAAIPADFPLLGTWVTSITKADLQAAGMTEEGLLNENSGRFTWTFNADGTWTQVQESLDGSPINSPVFRGTFAINGDSLVATTQFPERYADSGLRYTWKLDGDAVNFDILDSPDEILPLIVETNEWTRPT